jgi:hypothetical protein
MFGEMYTISRDAGGVTLRCNECWQTVRVNEFDHRLDSPRTQAARAMLKHSRNEHRKELIGKPLHQTMDRWC